MDCVVSTVPAPGVEAVTLTGVLTVPAFTVIVTNPKLFDTAVGDVAGKTAAGVSVIPPTVVLNPKVTVFPPSAPPPESTTLNTTCEFETPPVPCNAIVVGVAETYCIEPVMGGVTTKDDEAVADVPDTVAVTVSVAPQPLSR